MPEESLLDEAPWKQRFRVPRLWTQVARAVRTRGLAVTNQSGVFQLYAWDVPTGEKRQLTKRADGVISGTIAPDGRHVYYLDDRHGNEVGHYVRVPFEGGAPEDVTPDLPPYASWDLAVSHSGNRLACILAGPEGFDLYALDLGADGAPGTPRRLYRSPSFALGLALSRGGASAVIGSTEGMGQRRFRLLAFDVSDGRKIGELWDGIENSVAPVAFSPLPGDDRLLATSNRTGDRRPLLWNPRTGERRDLSLDVLEGEVVPEDWSPDGRSILLCQFHHAIQRLYLYDLAEHTLTRLQHPAGTLWGPCFGPDGEIFTHWQDSTHSLCLIALDRETGALSRTGLPASDAPPGRSWKSVTFPSSDGQEIQAWLGLPDGEGPFPTILETHGGPEAVTTDYYSPWSQVWLDHGFAYLTINYRGSTTFGREFLEQIWGDLGHWEVEDMVAGRAWLVEQGIARPDQVFVTGWSYGGYLTLQALGKYPDLWAGGMAGVAIADYAAALEDAADTLKASFRLRMGGRPEEQPERYAASSPITYAANVKAPLLVIQGRHDSRCPARQMELYEAKMRSLGKDIEVHWFDAGHGSLESTQIIEHCERMLGFALRILS